MKHETKKNRERIKGIQPNIRFLKDMKEVVRNKDFAKKNPNIEVYYMYRGVDKTNGLRYDITVVPPKMLGKEFAKTKGHTHLNNFQELYTVLKGEAIFLMQKSKRRIVKNVVAIKAKRGDWVIVPPKYTHIIINPLKKELKTANFVSEKCKNIYEELEETEGACYYYTKSGWIKNKNYKKIPKIRWAKPLKERPKNLNFLERTNI